MGSFQPQFRPRVTASGRPIDPLTIVVVEFRHYTTLNRRLWWYRFIRMKAIVLRPAMYRSELDVGKLRTSPAGSTITNDIDIRHVTGVEPVIRCWLSKPGKYYVVDS